MASMMKWLMLMAAAAAMISSTAGLAVMSIDFGSEFMKIAIVKPGVPMEIALNKESRRKTPVIVSMKDGERLFSDPALSVSLKYPKYAYKDLLDLLGKKASNPMVKEYMKKYPYYTIEADPDNGLVVFKEGDATYSVEELVAMILESARVIASDYAEQPITETVITIPPYFNQAERRALLRAGEMAGLKVLQLLNDNTAVALNYGVFRRKEFNGTAVNYMFIDMGSSKTTVTLAAYQVVKAKNPATGVEETFPQVAIKGVGFDRLLGGKDFQARLADHLAREFTRTKKTSSDVYDSPRALEKLYKEAGRLKHVLSANVGHFAQIEGLLDDEDFRVKVTRDQFEEMCSDLLDRVDDVIADAMKSTEITMDEINEVILMGGGTRVPRIQEIIQTSVNRPELGKSINTDEASALGASYQAAHLSKGYKVKKFGIKDANIFPIQVEFERARMTDDGAEVSKTIKRTLFGRMNPFPQKKVMTFNKHMKDFGFLVNYGDLSFLSDRFLESFGKSTLQEVALLGVEDAHVKHSQDGEAKGTKAHFRMDDNGILVVDKVESLFEKLVPDEDKKEESTLSKIGSTISNFFGGGSEDKKDDKEGSVDESKDELKDQTEQKETPVKEDEKNDSKEEKSEEKETNKEPEEESEPVEKEEEKKEPAEESKEEEESEEEESDNDTKQQDSEEKKADDLKTDSETKDDSKTDDAKSDGKDTKSESDEKAKDGEKEGEKKDGEKDGQKKDGEKDEEKKEVKTKPVPVKEEIASDVLLLDVADPSPDQITASKKKIKDLRKKDEEKKKLAEAQNELESFIIDTQDKLYNELYEKCSTEEERDEIRTKFSEASDWLYEQEPDAERKLYEDKLRDLRKVTSGLYQRVYEAAERPKAMDTLNSITNYTEFFLSGMQNLTGEDQPFTDVEVTTLKLLIASTKEWNATVQEDQANTPMHEKPKLLVEDIARKIGELDREVKYLMNKLKTFRPKPKPKPKPQNSTDETSKKTNTTSKKTTDSGEKTTNDTIEIFDDTIQKPEEGETVDSKTTTETPAEEETLELPAAETDDEGTKTTTEEEESSHKKSSHDPDDEL